MAVVRTAGWQLTGVCVCVWETLFLASATASPPTKHMFIFDSSWSDQLVAVHPQHSFQVYGCSIVDFDTLAASIGQMFRGWADILLSLHCTHTCQVEVCELVGSVSDDKANELSFVCVYLYTINSFVELTIFGWINKLNHRRVISQTDTAGGRSQWTQEQEPREWTRKLKDKISVHVRESGQDQSSRLESSEEACKMTRRRTAANFDILKFCIRTFFRNLNQPICKYSPKPIVGPVFDSYQTLSSQAQKPSTAGLGCWADQSVRKSGKEFIRTFPWPILLLFCS